MRIWNWCKRTVVRLKLFLNPQEAAPPLLREFVYLDEVSVISLLSSQVGEIKSEVSSATTLAEQAELTSGISASSGVAKAEVGSKYQTTSSFATQITRKSNIQSKFRDLIDAIDPTFALYLRDATPEDSKRNLKELISDPDLCRPTTSFVRGDLIEVTVELEADPVFKLSTILSEVYDLGVQYPELLGASNLPPEMAEMVKVFDKLLSGLVPVRGQSVDYLVISHDGEQYVVRNSTAKLLGIAGTPLTVVGVTDQGSYWKDLRRILFTKARFTMLCRIDKDGVQHDWTPVKLADVFSDAVPGLGNLTVAMNEMTDAMLQGADHHEVANNGIGPALTHYADRLLSRPDVAMSSENSDRLRALISSSAQLRDHDLEGQRILFDEVTTLVGVQITPQEGVELRRESRLASGLTLFGQSSATSSRSDRSRPLGGPGTLNDTLLDVEIVAIYW